ncbi:hypothetical protein ACFE04_026512 [Oxalis oulophora]
MKNSEEPKPSKSDKSSPPPVDQNNVHVYPDWAAMQAYYGPRMPLPPYYNSGVAPGHAPPHPYMWPPPQAMMGPYGPPYAAMYSPGGVYAHPAGPHGHVVSSSPIVATPLSVEMPTKSTGNTDGGLIRKLKKVEGLAMSIGNGNAQGADHGTEQRSSPSSEDDETTDGSDGNTSGDQIKRKTETLSSPDMATPSSKRRATIVPTGAAGNVMRPGFSPSLDAKASPANMPGQSMGAPPETWIQAWNNERELKRERRKQSNRESARRSRLRKQAESEELAHKVDALTAENMALRSEISQFNEKSEKLKLENAALMEKMKNAQPIGGNKQITLINNIDDERAPADNTENLLSRVDNNSGSVKNTEEVEEPYNPNAKLHQLLDTSARADAVAAG